MGMGEGSRIRMVGLGGTGRSPGGIAAHPPSRPISRLPGAAANRLPLHLDDSFPLVAIPLQMPPDNPVATSRIGPSDSLEPVEPLVARGLESSKRLPICTFTLLGTSSNGCCLTLSSYGSFSITLPCTSFGMTAATMAATASSLDRMTRSVRGAS